MSLTRFKYKLRICRGESDVGCKPENPNNSYRDYIKNVNLRQISLYLMLKTQQTHFITQFVKSFDIFTS